VTTEEALVMSDRNDPGYIQRLVGDVRILVLGRRMLTDAEFDAHILEAVGMAGAVRVVLLAILGSPPMSAERRAKLEQAGLVRIPTAVLTESMAVRAILTALRWLGGDARPFPMQGDMQACEFLAIPANARQHVAQELRSMIADLAVVAPPVGSQQGTLSRTVQRIEQAVTARAGQIRKRAK
jgi:hypothetical protein